MFKAIVTFFGDNLDAFGMPDPFYSYLVVVSSWKTPYSGVASIVPLSLEAPLSRNHFLVTIGGERAAFDAAIAALKAEPGNARLAFHSEESPL